MEEYERNRTAGLLALRAFPRSLGLLAGAGSLVYLLEPVGALVQGLVVWFLAFLFRSIFISPKTVDTNLWSCLSTPILAIGAWPVKWTIYIGLVIFSLTKGAPFEETVLYMGGFLAFDIAVVFMLRS